MTKSFQACCADTPIIGAIRIFSKYNLDIIPIVNEMNILIGIMTKNKMIHAISEGYSLEESIKLLINYNPIYVFPDADILEIRKKLLHFQIRHAPVIDEEK